MAEKIRVLIVDDHALIREGITLLLKAHPDIEVVGEAENGSQALEKVRQLQPEIVLMDLTMPQMGGIEACKLIKEKHPEVQILALTVHEMPEYFFRILSAGASGYVLKGASSEELLAGIRAVHRGGVYLYPGVAKKLLEDYLQRVKSGEVTTSYDGLTERERQVLKLIGDGKTNQEIADLLYLSPNTVQTHCSRIMDKLKLHNRAELIRYAVRKGLIDME